MCERGKHFPNESKRCKSNYKIKRDLRKTMGVLPFSLKNGYLNNCLKNAFFFFLDLLDMSLRKYLRSTKSFVKVNVIPLKICNIQTLFLYKVCIGNEEKNVS